MNVSLVRCIRLSVAFVSPTSVQETTRSESELFPWLEMARGHTFWTSMWLKVSLREMSAVLTSVFKYYKYTPC